MALKVCVVKVVVIQPKAPEGKVHGFTELRWVGVGVGLGVVEDEVVKALSLGEDAGVGHGLVEAVIKHRLNQAGRLCR